MNGTITKYLYDHEDILLETDNNDTVVARYTHGPGIDEPLIMSRGGQSYYYVTDGLGSVTKLVNSSGSVVNSYVYDSFGNMASKTESVPNPYTYTAREFDPESGLYYYRARYYDAEIGRFISEDKIGFSGGVNFYVYCYNRPIIFIDPYGLYSMGDFFRDFGEQSITAGYLASLFPGTQVASVPLLTFGAISYSVYIAYYSKHPFIDTTITGITCGNPMKNPIANEIFNKGVIEPTGEATKRILDEQGCIYPTCDYYNQKRK